MSNLTLSDLKIEINFLKERLELAKQQIEKLEQNHKPWVVTIQLDIECKTEQEAKQIHYMLKTRSHVDIDHIREPKAKVNWVRLPVRQQKD